MHLSSANTEINGAGSSLITLCIGSWINLCNGNGVSTVSKDIAASILQCNLSAFLFSILNIQLQAVELCLNILTLYWLVEGNLEGVNGTRQVERTFLRIRRLQFGLTPCEGQEIESIIIGRFQFEVLNRLTCVITIGIKNTILGILRIGESNHNLLTIVKRSLLNKVIFREDIELTLAVVLYSLNRHLSTINSNLHGTVLWLNLQTALAVSIFSNQVR